MSLKFSEALLYAMRRKIQLEINYVDSCNFFDKTGLHA
jgi:hypothetical protein